MDDFMLNNREQAEIDVGPIVRPFDEAIGRTAQLWGDLAFQRWDGQRWRQQALAGLFDAEMIAASLLTTPQVNSIAQKQAQVVKATKQLFQDSEFEESVRLGTNTPARIRYRISRVYDTLLALA